MTPICSPFGGDNYAPATSEGITVTGQDVPETEPGIEEYGGFNDVTLFSGASPRGGSFYEGTSIMPRGGFSLGASRPFADRARQFVVGGLAIGGGVIAIGGSPSIGPFAPVAAASGAIGISVGLGNVVAAFGPASAQQQAILAHILLTLEHSRVGQLMARKVKL